jgi:hypothetical protein
MAMYVCDSVLRYRFMTDRRWASVMSPSNLSQTEQLMDQYLVQSFNDVYHAIKISVSWGVMPCSLVDTNKRCGKSCCLHIQYRRVSFMDSLNQGVLKLWRLRKFTCVKFEVLVLVTMKITLFWNVTPCSQNRYLGLNCCLHFWVHYSEDKVITLLLNTSV